MTLNEALTLGAIIGTLLVGGLLMLIEWLDR